ncbi:conserved hypothetical protein [Talaromyces stipitatus ATCC 10500]|uniref:Phosphoribosyltransferase domain-containing protein n=1 Tax=Talaromyces stipitatus (strain ATCC 10500 / CBS 375.48 / QM 6759 / NRRL 1006) TaxID=441959 RepID=B8MAW8_TALSN|nr:uncharacterized protein TSTA_123970 [Talaromyces stipitatus ATCC 10500]EED18669.1 conserved hypothetical protein [Talaromyces stipitatus ATCC 10500]
MTEQTPTSPNAKPTVIGLYGIPGCGKTFLLKKLKVILRDDKFIFFDGSDVIKELVPGGLDAFSRFPNSSRKHWRTCAIKKIKKDAEDSGKTAIVAGHFMFWSEVKEKDVVCNEADLNTYTHILYLDVQPKVIAQRRLEDQTRNRANDSMAHLQEWQDYEKSQMRKLCHKNSILFMSLSPRLMDLSMISKLIMDFHYHNEKINSASIDHRLDEIMARMDGPVETMLVLDADRTLTAEDTGKLFWDDDGPGPSRLDGIFRKPLRYSYLAFRQAMLFYEETYDDDEFDRRCRDVATRTSVYPEFLSLLRLVKAEPHVGAVIVTSGLGRVWEKVLQREGLSEKIKVIGGGRLSDRIVVTPSAKEAVVDRLQEHYKTYVWAFGDSPLDIPMLKKANQAIIVVGNKNERSKTMDEALEQAFEDADFKPQQVVLPSDAPPRLDATRLPVMSLTQQQFTADVFTRGRPKQNIDIISATDRTSAKLLMTAMRDARNNGPILCKAHRRVGSYLATEFVSSVIGVEKSTIPHVQGYSTDGYRLFREDQTLIVSLMRGGDPMARGVWDVFPCAMYLHAKNPTDIKCDHLDGQINILLVDSVVNTGKSIAEFVQHIRNLHPTVRVVVVAGVVQAECTSSGHLSQVLAGSYDSLSIVTLRLSQNRYTGSGSTDTGNRLFNTKHLHEPGNKNSHSFTFNQSNLKLLRI